MSTDDRVAAANRLGAVVTYDHPMPPRRDRFGAPWCPVCNFALQDPTYIDATSMRKPDGSHFLLPPGTTAAIFSGACSGCKQVLTWTGWSRYLSDSERLAHINGGCRGPNYCHRCREQLSA